MPRKPYFGDKTPKVVEFLKKISEFNKAKRTQLSLTTMAQRVRAEFPGTPGRKKPTKKGEKEPTDNLRHILFKLAKKHEIWFGADV
jgi:hypothetical protein